LPVDLHSIIEVVVNAVNESTLAEARDNMALKALIKAHNV